MNRLNTSPMTSALKRRIRTTVAAIVVLSVAPIAIHSASATEAGPNGANVGFDFTWDDFANPLGTSASFLETDGTTAKSYQRQTTMSFRSRRMRNTQMDAAVPLVRTSRVPHRLRGQTDGELPDPPVQVCSEPTIHE